MQSIEITSLEDFQLIVTRFSSKKGKIAFRGQTSERSLIPSIYRGNITSARFPGCIPSLTANWNVCAKRIVSGFGVRPNNFKIEAIMQHYGYRSTFIDVSTNPIIALWFALHQFKNEQAPLFIGDELRSAVFQRSYYVSTQKGYVYIVKCPSHADHRYVELTKIMPESAKRIHKQEAGAIFCSPKRISADSLIIKKFTIIDDGWFSKSKYNLKTSELFPPPSADTFYRQLCTIPYYITPDKEEKKLMIGHPLLGMFPIYAQSPKEIILEYAPFTKILQTYPSLKWNIAREVVNCEDKRFKVRGATKIIFSRLMTDHVTKLFSWKRICKNSLPSNNLIFEFEPEASIVTPSTKALDQVVLGLWVVFGDKYLHVAEIVDNFKELLFNHGCIYSLPDLTLIQKSCNCSDHNKDLSTILYLLHELSRNVLKLRKLDSEYWMVTK